MICLLNSLKIIVSLCMIVFGVRLFVYSKQIKRMKIEKIGREGKLKNAKTLASRGITDILHQEQTEYDNLCQRLEKTEVLHEHYTILLSISSIFLGGIEILLTIPQFKN